MRFFDLKYDTIAVPFYESDSITSYDVDDVLMMLLREREWSWDQMRIWIRLRGGAA